jgi:hypothetical protein
LSEDESIHAALAEVASQAGFHHRDHVRLAWRLNRELGVDAAPGAVARAIQFVAARHGEPGKYHETLTHFWARVVGRHSTWRPDLVAPRPYGLRAIHRRISTVAR